MTPNEIQIFYQAMGLSKAGKNKAAHYILEGLLPNNSGDPQLLMWLIYTSTEQTQGRTYLTRLAVAKPESAAENITAARNWIMTLPYQPPTGMVMPGPNPANTPPVGYTATLSLPRLNNKLEKKSIFGGRITWIIDLDYQTYTIALKQSNLFPRRIHLTINNVIVSLSTTSGVLQGGRKEDYIFKLVFR